MTVRQDPFPVDAFANAGSATTNATGDWSLAVKPTANTRYQARSGKADSPAVDVMVRPAISLKLSDRTPKRGQRVTLLGHALPRARRRGDRASAAHRNGLAHRREARARGRGGRHLLLVLAQACGCAATALTGLASWATRDHVAGNSRVRRAAVH